MTASLHRLGAGAGAGTYYTNDSAREANPARRDEYYLAEGGGFWWSSGETVVRHGAAIDRATFHDLCAGRDPRTGQPLVRGAGQHHWAGQDCTLSPGKTVSLLWMAGTPEQRAAIEAANRAAVERALEFVVAEGLVTVRTGAGGTEAHRPSDLIVGRFEHFTTREGDPNIHTHCVIMNVAGYPGHSRSGRYYNSTHLTIDLKLLYNFKLTVGAAFRAALADELRQRFDLRYRAAGRGQWEIEGLPDALLEAYSKRSVQIQEKAGPGATSAQRQVATLVTRRGKDEVPTGPELEARWRAELAEFELDPWLAVRRLERTAEPALVPKYGRRPGHELPFDPPEIPGEGPVALAASALMRHESVILRKDLLQHALELAGVRGLGIEAVRAELTRLEQEGALLRLAAAELSPGAGACWTSPGIAACEAAMLRAADRPLERAWIAPVAVEAALLRADHLSPEQGEAVRHAAGSDGVSLLQAGAGTGKTTTAAALVAAAHASGLRVVGLAPSWVAADELARSIGIQAQAIARWRHDCTRGTDLAAPRHLFPAPVLDDRTLVLVDEAGMVSTRDLQAVLGAAQAAGAKVILVGDRRQLTSVGGASALRAVAEIVGRSALLTEVRRQSVDWQRAASVAMARGDSEAGLRSYADRGEVELVSGPEAAQDRVIALWSEQRAVHGQDALIVTRRNADAAALNARARAALRAEGRLGPDLVALPGRDRADRPVLVTLAIGDAVRFGEGLPHLGVRNGNRARVEGLVAEPDGGARLKLLLDDGRILDEPWHRLSREPLFGRKPSPPRLLPAYAGTAHAAQGRTAAACVLYLARGTDAREVYVGLTRHRHEARVVVESDRLDALCRQGQADPRIPPTRAALLERLFREARGTHDKANVVDYAVDRVDFVRAGALALAERAMGIDVRRAVRAARALSEAFAWLRLDQMAIPAWRLVDAYGVRMVRPLSMQADVLLARVGGRFATARSVEPRRDYGPER